MDTPSLLRTAIEDHRTRQAIIARGIPPERLSANAMRNRLPRLATIRQLVAEFYGLDEPTMLSRRRMDSIVWPRQVAMFFAREFTVCSSVEVGREFGNRDHVTVLNAVNVVRDRRTIYPAIKAELNQLEALIEKRLKEEAAV